MGLAHQGRSLQGPRALPVRRLRVSTRGRGRGRRRAMRGAVSDALAMQFAAAMSPMKTVSGRGETARGEDLTEGATSGRSGHREAGGRK